MRGSCARRRCVCGGNRQTRCTHDEFGRMLRHDALLPALEDDRSQMLASGAVLWKQLRPQIGVGVDDHDGAATTTPDRMSGTKRHDRAADALDDNCLAFVPRNFKAIRFWCTRDIAVAQIDSEQVTVRCWLSNFWRHGYSIGAAGGGGRTRTCTSFRTEDFKSSMSAVPSRPRPRPAHRFLNFSLTSRMRFCRASSSASACVLRWRSASSCSSMPLFAPTIHLSMYCTQVGRWPSSDLKTRAWCIMPRRRG